MADPHQRVSENQAKRSKITDALHSLEPSSLNMNFLWETLKGRGRNYQFRALPGTWLGNILSVLGLYVSYIPGLWDLGDRAILKLAQGLQSFCCSSKMEMWVLEHSKALLFVLINLIFFRFHRKLLKCPILVSGLINLYKLLPASLKLLGEINDINCYLFNACNI